MKSNVDTKMIKKKKKIVLNIYTRTYVEDIIKLKDKMLSPLKNNLINISFQIQLKEGRIHGATKLGLVIYSQFIFDEHENVEGYDGVYDQ